MQSRFIAGGAILIGALGFLIYSSLQAGTMQSVPVKNLRDADAKSTTYVGKRLRMVGFVGSSPVHRKPTQTSEGLVQVAQFDVVEGKDKVLVSYADALPDTFRAGGPVQVDGVYVSPGVMKADHVLTKCPSKYQAGEKAALGADGQGETGQSVDSQSTESANNSKSAALPASEVKKPEL